MSSVSTDSPRSVDGQCDAPTPAQRIESMSDLYINRRLTIPAAELDVSTSRSGGPGGQNVNKVNSKVTLRWSPSECQTLNPAWRKRLVARYGNRINRDGQLILQSQRHRDQVRNIADVRGKLAAMLRECEFGPKKRKATRPTRGSQLRRLDEKKRTGQKKSLRKRPRLDD